MNYDTSYIFTKYVQHGLTTSIKNGLSYLGMLECSLPVAFIDNLHRNTSGSSIASSIMGRHISPTTRHQRQFLHQLHINLQIVDSHEGQSNKSSTLKMLTNKMVDGLPILESFQQDQKAVELVIQRKHYLMNNRQSRMTCLSLPSGLRNSILKHS
jgi:hypothetical protein